MTTDRLGENAASRPLGRLVGDDVEVPVGGATRRYVDLDAAATTSASAAVVRAVQDFLPWYSSVHRGAGAKSRYSSARYEEARETVLRFVGADPATHVALFPRNTTEALNVVAFRLALTRGDVVVTTAVEHHANLLPWRRHAQLRVVDVDRRGVFDVAAVVAALDETPRPRVLAVTGASNITGWAPDLPAVAAAARERGVLVVVDGAQLVPHRPVTLAASGIDVLAFSGHKMHAPFGAGALVLPRRLLADGEPFLVGGGAVRAVSYEEVLWADPPDRDDAGSPNVVGAVALAAAAEELAADRETRRGREDALVRALDDELATVPGLRRLGPTSGDRLPVAAFTLDGVPHGRVATWLADGYGIGVRNGCFCAHPYLTRLLGLSDDEVRRFHADARADRYDLLPGAVRVSCDATTSPADITVLGEALRTIATTGGPTDGAPRPGEPAGPGHRVPAPRSPV
ncbi:aminotransferase class V-fold PLP-dependent enzyme [Modestobacter marinus]|uniref:Aminotransferase/cysteine desulfurase n=1 Tax=Modestobacter marinus TaxID=477641 RepID=A0A846LE37_9ACTN|nr:aminotransferase class V-fold PLP-dependent enzyme [Modestobacter marinus]NIH65966.1 selenocysteine lyase/cysteine desulfurase [Modestobacter marinus]GGL68547.1 putative aminotransferase/cysteine desulfurase [Modestobacter marinus]